MKNIKFLLSDLDGVIRHFPNERNREIEDRFGLPANSLLSTAFEKTLLASAVCGLITDEVWRQEIVRVLSASTSSEAVEGAVRDWSAYPGQVDVEYLNLLDRRFPGVPISLLTNATTRLHHDLKKLNLHKCFFKIFNSSEIGICKPDPRVYTHVINTLGCLPSEILFIDDSAAHVRAAQEAGMNGRHFTSLENFKGSYRERRKKIRPNQGPGFR